MSVPVRYSAAAEYAVVVDERSGLDLLTLQQEEQYHLQQQQLQQQQLQLQQQQLELQHQQQQYYEEQLLKQQQEQQYNNYYTEEGALYCRQLELEQAVRRQQQQQELMQQRSLMSSSSSVMPTTNIGKSNAATIATTTNNTNTVINNNMDATTINAILVHDDLIDDDEQPTTSAQAQVALAAAMNKAAAVAAAAAANSANVVVGIDQHNDTDMRTDWMRMSDEGRYGTPGAAGLEYQKYDEQQQQQQQESNNNKNPLSEKSTNNGPTTLTTSTCNNMPPASATSATESSGSSGMMDMMENKKMNLVEEQLNAMTTEELYNSLKEYDALQDKYHTVLLLPKESRREVTAGGRDGSAYVLRCLKMWYELPSDVLFSAMSLVDRFLDRMAVKPKHMACMSVASFHLAIKQLDLKPIPAEDLVTISQCGCTAGDLERMAGVIANKLGVQMGHGPITSVSYLRIYYALFRNMAKDIGGEFFKFYQQLIKLEELENRLEILLCDVRTTVITPSTLALVLLCLHLDLHIKESYTRGSPELKHVFEYILFLQQYMRIPDRVFTCGFSVVSEILSHYNGQNKAPYKQRLVWKLSSRTLRVLRPMNRFSSDLPTIEEGISNALDDGLRSRTESISSEEEEDWPTSPIIPIFEQC